MSYLSSTPQKSAKNWSACPFKMWSFESCGPDAIPNRILKLFASKLCEPLTTIFNRSLSSGDLPLVWRDAYISPIPKASPVTCGHDLRPVACIGSIKGVSTTFCLLDMLHNWLSALESPGTYLIVCFLDSSKAFDHIDHNILVCKLF